MCTAAAPALIIERIVRSMLNALPQPVSMSTSSGSVVTSVIRRTSIKTSSRVLIARSGMPSELAATPPPDRYSALKPVASAIRAVYALMAPITDSALFSRFSSTTAWRNFEPIDGMWIALSSQQVLDAVLLVGQFLQREVHLLAAEGVDVETLHDLVLAVLRDHREAVDHVLGNA